MKRVWRETISPKWMHDTLGVFNGYWLPQMDRLAYGSAEIRGIM